MLRLLSKGWSSKYPILILFFVKGVDAVVIGHLNLIILKVGLITIRPGVSIIVIHLLIHLEEPIPSSLQIGMWCRSPGSDSDIFACEV